MKKEFYPRNSNLPAEVLERLRLVNHFDDETWQDLLEVNWLDYTMIRTGQKHLPKRSLLNISEYFNYAPHHLAQGDINFQDLQIKAEDKFWKIPAPYSFAAYGRCRTTITTFEYLERYHGWRLRYDVLKHLNLGESILTDPFAPISMKIITDTLAYLAKRHFTAKDFFAMGLYSFVGNANTLLGKHYAELPSPKEILEHMWSECLIFYEKNCLYRFLRLDSAGAVIEVKSDPLVAEEMKARHLGNEHICALKAGMMASAPMFLGHSQAQVVERCCAHKGDPSCIFEITFIPPSKANHSIHQ